MPSHTSDNHQTRVKINEALNNLCAPPHRVDPDWIPDHAVEGFLEINVALEGKNEGSACGMDGIDYYVLKILPTKNKLVLVDIFYEFHNTGIYPEQWNKSYVHFIGKPSGVGVRPLSLISCTCKVFKTMLKNKQQWWLEEMDRLPREQSGFRIYS